MHAIGWEFMHADKPLHLRVWIDVKSFAQSSVVELIATERRNQAIGCDVSLFLLDMSDLTRRHEVLEVSLEMSSPSLTQQMKLYVVASLAVESTSPPAPQATG